MHGTDSHLARILLSYERCTLEYFMIPYSESPVVGNSRPKLATTRKVNLQYKLRFLWLLSKAFSVI
jgi:hypothetical protein